MSKCNQQNISNAETISMRTVVNAFLFSLVVMTGCHSEPPSEIVRQVERAGAGDVRQQPVESLMRFFDLHARLAIRVETLCATKRKTDDVNWMLSNEGKVCQAVASRDRVKYLDDLETMKRMDTQNGDQNAAAEIDKAEGK
jgi:hypothetical protein